MLDAVRPSSDDAREAALLAHATAFAAEVARAAATIEATRRIPAAVLASLHEARLARLLLPRSLDGEQVHPCFYFRALEIVSRADASVGWNLFVANSSALIAAFLEPSVARTIFADPRALVAWGPPNATRIVAAPGGYRVSGRWDFASGCRQATWMGVHANVSEPDGNLRLNAAGRPTVRTVLFPVTEATLLDTWHTIGLKGTASDSYTVENVFVAEAFSTTREDPALRREPGPLYAFTMQGLYAVGSAAVAVGTARAMLSSLLELAGRKAPRGLPRMADSAEVQASIARNEARLGSATAYLLATLADVFARADEWQPIGVEDRARVRLSTVNAIHAAIEVADYCYAAAGVDAIFPGSPFERRFRDIHTLSQQIQARVAHYEAVGQVLLGLPPEPFY